MSINDKFNDLNKGKIWQDRVLEADSIWKQVSSMLSNHGLTLPKTPRRPDVRLIVNNTSGQDVQFLNPGDHSANKQELIPAAGNKTSAMIMPKGATLDEQYKNAQTLYKKYDLGGQGFSQEFIAALRNGELADLVDEAYGPAPFQSQAEKLVEVTWAVLDGTQNIITPEKGANAAYGARAATEEMVFLAQFEIYVKGTGTTSELVESSGMDIAVSSDWQSGAETTRPIVPSVAKTYYGAHVDTIPTVIVHPDGVVKEIDLKNGTTISLSDDLTTTRLVNKPSPPKDKSGPLLP